MRVALIANPNSGRRKGIIAAEAAERGFGEAGWETRRYLTQCAGDAVRLGRQAADEGFDAIFACGGDGSLAELLNGVVGSAVPVGVVPAGTGNDFARTVGLSIDPREAVRQIIAGGPQPVDLLDVNDGELWSVNVMGLGLDARVADRINRRTRVIGGMAAYLIALAQEFVNYRPTDVVLRMDDQTWEGRVILLVVANAISYGGGMKISPLSRIDDGLLDVVVVEYLGRLQFAFHFPKVLNGTHLSLPRIHHWQARQVSVETAEPAPVLADGDVKCKTPLSVRIAPGKVNLWLPPGALEGPVYGGEN